MDFLRYLVPRVFMPLPFCLIVCAIGVITVLITKHRRRSGAVCIVTGLLLLYFFSCKTGARMLMIPLEGMYRSYMVDGSVPPEGESANEAIRYIVVLGSGHVIDDQLPISTQINDTALVRLIEGIRLYRLHPDCLLVLSGGRNRFALSNAEVMARMSESLGVPDKDLVLESESRNTREEAELLQPLLSDKRFVLVTSASHMPRAMILFEKHGLSPIPAPTRHFIRHKRGQIPVGLSPPRALYLKISERALYEYYAIAWIRLQDWMDQT